MAHGNLSDFVFLALAAIVVQWLAFPASLFHDLGPLKAQFSTQNSDMDAIIKFGGGLLLMVAMTFSGVSWHKINGKMSGFGGFILVACTVFNTFRAKSYGFVLRSTLV